MQQLKRQSDDKIHTLFDRNFEYDLKILIIIIYFDFF